VTRPLYFIALLCFAAGGAAAFQPPQQRGVVPVSPKASGRRVALIVGNQGYPKQPLANPVNDATDLSSSLRGLGFQVTLATNLNKAGFERTIRAFAAEIQPGDSAVFFFSGHGMEVEGQNYLLPVDFDAQAEEEVKYQAMPASLVLERMQSRGARTSVLIFDACRNNPYRSWRSAGGGLASMSGTGVYVAFAAAPGRTADDNPGGHNGRFTKNLLEALAEPNLGIDDVFNRVRQKVAEESRGTQVPFSNSGLIGGFVFHAVDPAVRLTQGFGTIHFGMHPEQMPMRPSGYDWRGLAVAGEYRPLEVHYVWLPIATLASPLIKGSIWTAFASLQPCWNKKGYAGFMFTEKDGLFRISFRLFDDCSEREFLLSSWASSFQIPATGTGGHLMFRRVVNGIALEGHTMLGKAFIDIFPENAPQPPEPWWK
jgi:hypothetical protein